MPTDAITEPVLALARFLEYPDEHYRSDLALVIDSLAGEYPDAAEALQELHESLAVLSETQLQEEFTRAFDLSPIAVPYLSVHMFGEESYKRGAMMAWLQNLYSEYGGDTEHELPDHLRIVLRFAGSLPADDRDALFEFCVQRPTGWMREKLAAAESPFAALLAALQTIVGVAIEEEEGEQLPPSWEAYRNGLTRPWDDGPSLRDEEFRD